MPKKNYEEQISYLIKKGTAIPCSVEEPFVTTSVTQSSASLEIYQSGNSEQNKRFAHLIHKGEMKLPDNLPIREQIDVTFAFDEGGILHCKFVHTNSGTTETLSLTPEYEITDSDREKIDSFKIE